MRPSVNGDPGISHIHMRLQSNCVELFISRVTDEKALSSSVAYRNYNWLRFGMALRPGPLVVTRSFRAHEGAGT
jgi:hypothetical protein